MFLCTFNKKYMFAQKGKKNEVYKSFLFLLRIGFLKLYLFYLIEKS